MKLAINHNPPTIMYIDLNSCFATAEQQANPLLRGKPIAVAAYNSPGGCVISPSIEAKKLGIKVGMRVKDARLICKNIIIRMPDPPKYRDIHMRFSRLFGSYSPNVTPKSIDEAVIDFSNTPSLKRNLINVGKEIKIRMKKEIGEWISCNIGIATNRFLAKLAANLHKPNGLDLINHQNLKDVYGKTSLTDLDGINFRFQARLNAYHIFTPKDFFKASIWTLKKQVFQSICGYYWYLRLRGWEVDNIDFKRKSYGQSYALRKATNSKKELAPMLMKLCQKMSKRLRGARLMARTIHIFCLYKDRSHWHKSKTFNTPLYTTQDFYSKMWLVFNRQATKKIITHLDISCTNFIPTKPEQLELFDSQKTKKYQVADTVDRINDRYGQFVLVPGKMMNMDKLIIDRVAFGGVKEIENLYK